MIYNLNKYSDLKEWEFKQYVRGSEKISYSQVRRSITNRHPIPKVFTLAPDLLLSGLFFAGFFGTLVFASVAGVFNARTTAGSVFLGVLSLPLLALAAFGILSIYLGASDIPRNVSAYFADKLPDDHVVDVSDYRWRLLTNEIYQHQPLTALNALIDKEESADSSYGRIICGQIDAYFDATDDLTKVLASTFISEPTRAQTAQSVEAFAKFYADHIVKLIREYRSTEIQRLEREQQEASEQTERAKVEAEFALQSAQTQAESFAEQALKAAEQKLQDIRVISS